VRVAVVAGPGRSGLLCELGEDGGPARSPAQVTDLAVTVREYQNHLALFGTWETQERLSERGGECCIRGRDRLARPHFTGRKYQVAVGHEYVTGWIAEQHRRFCSGVIVRDSDCNQLALDGLLPTTNYFHRSAFVCGACVRACMQLQTRISTLGPV